MRTEVKLSKRLERIASFVQPGSRVADIGTDHGYVPIWLVQKGVCPSALAMDVRKGPLVRAEARWERRWQPGRRFISQEISATMKESTRLHRAWRSSTLDIMELNTFLLNLWRNI